MSYQNQHSLSQPYWNFLPSSLIFYPNEIWPIVAFVFIQLTCNNTIRSVCLSERREWKAKHFFHTQKELIIPNQQQKSKFFWLSLICLWSIWSLPKLNTNRYGNCFDQFHFELQPKGEKINNLGNFFIFAEASGKSSEIWVGFAANDFVFFPLSF